MRTSGRWRRVSAGMPMARLDGGSGMPRLPESMASRLPGLRPASRASWLRPWEIGLFERGDRGAGGFQAALGLAGFQRVRLAGLLPPSGESGGFLAGGDVLFQHDEPGLVGPEIGVGGGDFRGERGVHGVEVFLRRHRGWRRRPARSCGACRRDRLPMRRRARRSRWWRKRCRRGRCRVLREFRDDSAIQRGKKRGELRIAAGAGFPDAGGGRGDVGAVLERAGNQAVEHRIVEAAPPAGEVLARGGDGKARRHFSTWREAAWAWWKSRNRAHRTSTRCDIRRAMKRRQCVGNSCQRAGEP